MLGHANLSQADTYLNAGRMGLHEAMKRFDAARGKSVAKTEATEHRPVGHEHAAEVENKQLH
jgi:hypothetical protein